MRGLDAGELNVAAGSSTILYLLPGIVDAFRQRHADVRLSLHNVTGAPAISLPMGRTADGRPIGVMIQARRGDDRTLLELAYELEAAAPFARVWD